MSEPAREIGIDAAKANAFAERIAGALNDGALCLMLSIGHRTGLLDTLSRMEPSTSEALATAAGLQERYVREWLGAMVTSRVVHYEPATQHYWLPAEHAASLTRAAGADNLAIFAQHVSGLGHVEDDVIECFYNGGGVPYDKYPRFHEVMAEDSGFSVLAVLESRILPLVPGLAEQLKRGIRVLDLGCGRGLVLKRLAQLFPQSRFTGIDLGEDAIAYATSQSQGLANLDYLVRDLSDFDVTAEPEAFDFITTFDAVHDQGQPLRLLKGIHKALAPDGVYLMQDISGTGHVHEDIEHPMGTFLYTISCMHCMTVSLAQGGEGVGAMWGAPKAIEYLERAGFGSIETRQLEHDPFNNWYIVRK